MFPTFVSATGGNEALKTASSLFTVNPSTGHLGIGGNAGGNNSLYITGTSFGTAATVYGMMNDATIPVTATSACNVYSTNTSTTAGTYTTANMRHFIAQFGTVGQGNTITNMYGFQSPATTANNATVNYGFNGGLAVNTNVNNGQAAATITNVAVTSNVATLTVSAPHGYTTNTVITVAATTHTQLNGSGIVCIAGTTGSTIVYNWTTANISSVADTGSVTPAFNWNFYAAGTAPNYMRGNLIIGTSNTDNGTDKLQLTGSATFTDQVKSTLSTGTAPFVVASTTQVANLNVATAGNIASGAVNQILYQTGAGATGFIATGNNGVLVTDGSGVPTISSTLPTGLSIPGALMSTSNAVTAAGTTQGTATALTSDFNVVTTVGSGQGVVLQTSVAGKTVVVVNKGANALLVYPATSGFIDSLLVNVAISLPVNCWIEFNASSTTHWQSTANALINASGVSGVLSTANLGTGTQTSVTFLRGDGTWSSTLTGNSFTQDNTGAAAQLSHIFNTDTGQIAQFSWKTGNSARWTMGKNGTAEGGSNAGSDFFLTPFDDSGSSLGNAFKVTRSTGLVSITNQATVGINTLTATSGPIATLSTLVAGTSYTNGSYTNVALTGGSGSKALANITVSGTVVTVCTLVRGGSRYSVGDVLSAANTDIGGTGSGFTITVATTTPATLYVTDASTATIRLESQVTAATANQQMGAIYFATRDVNAGATGDIAYIEGVTVGTTGGGALRFYTAPAASATALALTVNSDKSLTFGGTLGAATFTGLVTTVASATGTAGFNLPHGAAPTSPVNGDMWTTSAGGLFTRINGATKTSAFLEGATFTGLLTTVASATGTAGFNVPHGSAPTSPVNGDVWTTTAGMFARINGGTIGPFGAAGSTANITGGTTGQIPYQTGVSTTGFTGPGSAGQVLQSAGAAQPVYSTATYPATGGANLTHLASNGTNWVNTTSTYADTFSAGTVLVAATGNTVTGVSTLPSGLTVPGLLTATNNAVAAAGSSQSDATALTNDFNVVTSSTSTQGVVLQTPVAGKTVVVVNQSNSYTTVYPPSGCTIDKLGTNVGIRLLDGQRAEFNAMDATHWYSTLAGIRIVGPFLSVDNYQSAGTSANLYVVSDATQMAAVRFAVGSGPSLRWSVYKDTTTEAGSNTGSNLVIATHADGAGSAPVAGTPVVTVSRADGSVVATGSIQTPMVMGQHVLGANYIVTAGYYVVVSRYLEIASGFTLEMGIDADLEIV
jgi:hypothetical protein